MGCIHSPKRSKKMSPLPTTQSRKFFLINQQLGLLHAISKITYKSDIHDQKN